MCLHKKRLPYTAESGHFICYLYRTYHVLPTGLGFNEAELTAAAKALEADKDFVDWDGIDPPDVVSSISRKDVRPFENEKVRRTSIHAPVLQISEILPSCHQLPYHLSCNPAVRNY